MAFFDLSLEELKNYKPVVEEPEDFDAFWKNAIEESKNYSFKTEIKKVDFGLELVQTYDITFNGYKGQKIKGWLIIPKNKKEKLPCIVEYIGYGGGRSFPVDHLLWANAGFIHFVMDTRGQGSSWSPGETYDYDENSNPQYPGFMTKGILSPENYYYKRVFIDAVMAVETISQFEQTESSKIAISGGSQGGGISLAVAGLLKDKIKIAMIDVPFLCHYRRAIEITDEYPYYELTQYLKIHRDKESQIYRTLSYFDGVNFAKRATATALFSIALMDKVCPPSTTFAAYNYYNGKKELKVYPYNGHEGGGVFHTIEKIKFLQLNLFNRG